MYRKYYDEVIILLGTGLRISELCGLTADDIDMENRLISIDHQLLRTCKGVPYIDEPKSHNDIRKVYMSTDVTAAFQRIMVQQGGKEYELDGLHGFLFLGRNGTPRAANDYQRVFRKIREKYSEHCGILLPKKLTPHTLRHTFCTNMAHSKINPKVLQYIMGHSNISITLEYYTHTDEAAAISEMKSIVDSQESTT